jgi:hypothetical protein
MHGKNNNLLFSPLYFFFQEFYSCWVAIIRLYMFCIMNRCAYLIYLKISDRHSLAISHTLFFFLFHVFINTMLHYYKFIYPPLLFILYCNTGEFNKLKKYHPALWSYCSLWFTTRTKAAVARFCKLYYIIKWSYKKETICRASIRPPCHFYGTQAHCVEDQIHLFSSIKLYISNSRVLPSLTIHNACMYI